MASRKLQRTSKSTLCSYKAKTAVLQSFPNTELLVQEIIFLPQSTKTLSGVTSRYTSPEFLAQSRLEKLALSTFSRSLSMVASEQQNAADQVSLKLPGSIHGIS